MSKTKIFLEGIVWGEGLRWHDDRLWLSDIYGKKVLRAGMDGCAETACEVPAMPSGLGFLPDGRLLIVAGDGKVLRQDGDTLTEVADLCKLAVASNDMVVDKRGNAYIGSYGYDIRTYKGGPAEGWITLVKPDGEMTVAGRGMMCPNGLVVTPDGKTLIAADTLAKQLVAYTIEEDGSLSERHVWAEMTAGPDGIGLDAEGAVWAATPHAGEVVRVQEGGKVLARVPCQDTPLCCALGGPERKTLFIVTVPVGNDLTAEEMNDLDSAASKAGSKVHVLAVDVAGAGCP